MLLFYVGENTYAIDSGSILRVVPKVILKRMPHAMKYIAGLLNLGGVSVPVVDFCQLIEHREARHSLHTRIILIKDPSPHSDRMVGILGEKVEEIIDLNSEQLSIIDFPLPSFPYLDKIYSDGKRVIQYVNVEEFFSFLATEIFKAPEKEHEGF